MSTFDRSKRQMAQARRGLFALATLIGVMACQLSPAEGIKDAINAASGRAGQDDPIRRRSAVDAVGRWVVERYSDKESAEYGILDVTKAPYSADPTGKKDSTQAIQVALKDARDARLVTFLPGGTYRVSDTLACIEGVVMRDRWLSTKMDSQLDPLTSSESPILLGDSYPCVLMGSRSAQRSRLILAPRSPGFGDPRKPKPVIHFWARDAVEWESSDWWPWPADYTPDPNGNPSISYNQMVVDVDISLGEGNAGAVGIDNQGAQGSVIESVTVDATGAFAGIHKAPGSGGGIHGLTVIGGRYGLYLKNDDLGVFWLGAQPVPVVSNVTLKGQTEFSILYTGRGPLTVVGGGIEGAGVQGQGPEDAPWNGAMSFVDTVFRTPKAACAITSNHSVYLHNVYFEYSKTVACIDQAKLKGDPDGWTHVEEYAAAATTQYPKQLLGISKQDAVYLNGHLATASEQVRRLDSTTPPADIQSRHALSPLPSWSDKGVANVRAAPYGAKGDGSADDAAAIQRAIDEHEAVFLPKGEYKLSRPLVLRSRTRLFGVSNVLSALTPMPSSTFMDEDHPAPLINTVGDPSARTELAFVELRVPVTAPSTYALRWRAGHGSVVRDVHPTLTFWEPKLPVFLGYRLSPMVVIEGSGGGRWYDLWQDLWWAQSPDYRHLLVDGTHESLSFYMLNPEHARGDAQVEFHNARNVDIYSLKAEDFFTVLWMRGCRAVRLYGYGGGTFPRPGWSILRIDDSDDFLLANVDPDAIYNSPEGWRDPRNWLLITDSPGGVAMTVKVHGIEQAVLYKRGNP